MSIQDNTTELWTPGTACPRCGDMAALVLFGATGDLTRRKLIPAIYSLIADDLLPCGLPIISVGRRAKDRDELISDFRAAVEKYARKRPLNEAIWESLTQCIYYVKGELDDPQTYEQVKEILAEVDKLHGGNELKRMFYLAIPPHFFKPVIENIKESGLSETQTGDNAWPRIVVEKPFGSDLETAQELNHLLQENFSEAQILRMDHYLGKETVQNLLVLRFANAIFEPLWNQKYIDSVQITMSETVGLEGRGQYFDQSGMLRDVVQNHILELLALVAMEPPWSMDADAIRDEKVKLLRSVRCMTPEMVATQTVRAQFTSGVIGQESAPGYLEETGISENSTTETFVALRLNIDNWRWAEVPILLRAGKRMRERVTEIAIRFKQAPHMVFQGQQQNIEQNTLVLRIQPDEGISLCFTAKQPGAGLSLQPVPMRFNFTDTFGQEPPEAYERLILAAIIGDATLFGRADSIEASWQIIDPIRAAWMENACPVSTYPAGSWGPVEADKLPAMTGDHWQDPDCLCVCDISQTSM